MFNFRSAKLPRKQQTPTQRIVYNGQRDTGVYIPSGIVRRRPRPLSAPAKRRNKSQSPFLFSHHGSISASSVSAFPRRKIIVNRPRPQSAKLRTSNSDLSIGLSRTNSFQHLEISNNAMGRHKTTIGALAQGQSGHANGSPQINGHPLHL